MPCVGALALAACALLRIPRLPTLDKAPAADKTCDSDPCDAAPRAIDPKAPATLYSVRFAGGAMKLPSAHADWYGLVLAGKLLVEGCADLGSWQAFRAPGGGRIIRGSGFVVLGVAGDEPVDQLEVRRGAPPHRADTAAPCEVADLGKLPEVTWAGGHAHARLVFRGGKSYFGLLYSDPGTGAPPHTHARSWEIALLLRGQGDVTAGDDIGPMAAGAAFAFRPGERHGFSSKGAEPTVAVQMYAPPGPEQRFLDLQRER